jgi:hypothetical protein
MVGGAGSAGAGAAADVTFVATGVVGAGFFAITGNFTLGLAGNLTFGLAGSFLANTAGAPADAFLGFSEFGAAVTISGCCIIAPKNNPAKKLRTTRRIHPTTSSIAFFLSNEIS